MIPSIEHKKILYCVLNWGLGHATRSTPLIEQLLQQKNQITIASSGEALAYLKKRFPESNFMELPDYEVKYHNSVALACSLGAQYFKIVNRIKKENQMIQRELRNQGYDLLISDSRFGCFSRKVKSVMISHQLEIKASVLVNRSVNNINRKWLHRFDEIWVPDSEDRKLSGDLSKNDKIKIPVKYIGPLSRFTKKEINVGKVLSDLVILSGPEPRRSQFALQMKEALPKETVFAGNCKAMDTSFYDEKDYVNLLLAAKNIHCRSGYSTIMDLYTLDVLEKAIFYPTPGQTEQEYLATLFQV